MTSNALVIARILYKQCEQNFDEYNLNETIWFACCILIICCGIKTAGWCQFVAILDVYRELMTSLISCELLYSHIFWCFGVWLKRRFVANVSLCLRPQVVSSKQPKLGLTHKFVVILVRMR